MSRAARARSGGVTRRGPLSPRRERAVLDRAQALISNAESAGDHLPKLHALTQALKRNYFTQGRWTRGWSAARVADEAVELLAKKIAAEEGRPSKYVRWSRGRAGRRGVWDVLVTDVQARLMKGLSQSAAIEGALEAQCERQGMSKREAGRYKQEHRQRVKQALIYRRTAAQAR